MTKDRQRDEEKRKTLRAVIKQIDVVAARNRAAVLGYSDGIKQKFDNKKLMEEAD